jgi:hypothetical protein
MPITAYFPLWTKRVTIGGSGRDPLGLSRVSDMLTDYLLPGIITTTDRARYYSFYPWAVREASQRSGGSSAGFEKAFQRLEAAFAICSKFGEQGDAPIVGIEQVNKKIAAAEGEDEITTDFKVLPSNDLGGFGQYYAGCLRGLRLIQWDDNGTCDVTESAGAGLADAFAASVSQTSYIRRGAIGSSAVSRKVLSASSGVFSLDALDNPSASLERRMLIDMFLGFSGEGVDAADRQGTLGLFFHVLSEYRRHGLPVWDGFIDSMCLHWPHYYGCLFSEDGPQPDYTAPAAFTEAAAGWRQFCLHQLFIFGTESFLAAVLDTLGTHRGGMGEEELLDELCSKDMVDELSQSADGKAGGPAEFLAALGLSAVPDSGTSKRMRERYHPRNELHEFSIYDGDDNAPEDRTAQALLMLSLLYAKWRGIDDDETFSRVRFHAGAEWWIGTSFEWIDSWFDPGLSWREAVRRLLHTTLGRHDRVKFRKRRLDASWLMASQGRYERLRDLSPEFRSSRHRNASRILHDVGLLQLDRDEETCSLTADGAKQLQRIIQARQ